MTIPSALVQMIATGSQSELVWLKYYLPWPYNFIHTRVLKWGYGWTFAVVRKFSFFSNGRRIFGYLILAITNYVSDHYYTQYIIHNRSLYFWWHMQLSTEINNSMIVNVWHWLINANLFTCRSFEISFVMTEMMHFLQIFLWWPLWCSW